MSNYDNDDFDFRDELLEDDDDFSAFDDPEGSADDDLFGSDSEAAAESGGMTAVERAVLAFFGLLNVIALVVMVLILTGRIGGGAA